MSATDATTTAPRRIFLPNLSVGIMNEHVNNNCVNSLLQMFYYMFGIEYFHGLIAMLTRIGAPENTNPNFVSFQQFIVLITQILTALHGVPPNNIYLLSKIDYNLIFYYLSLNTSNTIYQALETFFEKINLLINLGPGGAEHLQPFKDYFSFEKNQNYYDTNGAYLGDVRRIDEMLKNNGRVMPNTIISTNTFLGTFDERQSVLLNDPNKLPDATTTNYNIILPQRNMCFLINYKDLSINTMEYKYIDPIISLQRRLPRNPLQFTNYQINGAICYNTYEYYYVFFVNGVAYKLYNSESVRYVVDINNIYHEVVLLIYTPCNANPFWTLQYIDDQVRLQRAQYSQLNLNYGIFLEPRNYLIGNLEGGNLTQKQELHRLSTLISNIYNGRRQAEVNTQQAILAGTLPAGPFWAFYIEFYPYIQLQLIYSQFDIYSHWIDQWDDNKKEFKHYFFEPFDSSVPIPPIGKVILDTTPDKEIYDLLDMGSHLKKQYLKSIESNTFEFKNISDENKKSTDKEVDIQVLYNNRENYFSADKKKPIQKYSIFNYNNDDEL